MNRTKIEWVKNPDGSPEVEHCYEPEDAQPERRLKTDYALLGNDVYTQKRGVRRRYVGPVGSPEVEHCYEPEDELSEMEFAAAVAAIREAAKEKQLADERGTIINCGFDDCAHIDRNGQCSCDDIVLDQVPGRRGFGECDSYMEREAAKEEQP